MTASPAVIPAYSPLGESSFNVVLLQANATGSEDQSMPTLSDVELKVSSVRVSIDVAQASRAAISTRQSRQVSYVQHLAAAVSNNKALCRVTIVALIAICGLVVSYYYSRE
jgi:hypothetical protein